MYKGTIEMYDLYFIHVVMELRVFLKVLKCSSQLRSEDRTLEYLEMVVPVEYIPPKSQLPAVKHKVIVRSNLISLNIYWSDPMKIYTNYSIDQAPVSCYPTRQIIFNPVISYATKEIYQRLPIFLPLVHECGLQF